ncbi:MAG TPA: tRNA lysidine(34) synthetase TilS [Acidobacteria bacterium]|nr:tRNA lysidine(34) synthetase TilS [Acidobacteriota bacterium]
MIYQKFKNFVEAGKLFSPQSRLLVAVSGGQDSVALVHLLVELKKKDWPQLQMALAHFNHKLRKSADEDELFVRNLAEELGLKIFSGRADVKDFARKKQLNLEEAARLKRYEFLRKAAGKFEDDYILTAHTMTDQAETVLMKIFRGTGLEGLQGIRLKAGNIVRPLLLFDRQELEDYLRENHLEFRQDETNEDERFLRNKIRLKLIPILEKEFDPAITSHLTEAALIAQGENEVLSQLVEKIWSKVKHGDSSHLELNLQRLERMPPGLARRLVRKYLKASLGLESPTFHQTQTVLALKDGQKFSWGRSKVLVREAGWLRKVEKTKRPKTFSLSWDGRSPLRLANGLEFVARFISVRKLPPARRLRQFEFDDAKRCYLDASKVTLPLEVRNRRPGDKYQPLGLCGQKKIKECLQERKIPQAERDGLPVFLSAGKIVWVPGLPVSEEFKVIPSTENILLISALVEAEVPAD